MSHRAILLTNPSLGAKALARALVAEGMDVRLVLTGREPAPAPSKRLIPRMARSVLGNAVVNRIGSLALGPEVKQVVHAEERLSEQAENVLEGGINAIGILPGWPPGVPCQEVADMNAAATVQLVRTERPDVLVVFGASILRQPMLSIAPAINAHTSLLPHYRGTRSEFWQCRLEDPAHVGISIHLIDQGVDTGPLLFQRPTATAWPTDPFHLRSLNTLEVIRHMPQVVRAFLEGRITPFGQPPGGGRTYRNNDITIADRQAVYGHCTV